jgi:hypothetical protein
MKCPICSGTGEVVGPTHSTLLALFTKAEVADLRRRYPRLDLEYEAQKCTNYWVESRRRMKLPQTAYYNWLEIANKRLGPDSEAAPATLDAKAFIERYGNRRGSGPLGRRLVEEE